MGFALGDVLFNGTGIDIRNNVEASHLPELETGKRVGLPNKNPKRIETSLCWRHMSFLFFFFGPNMSYLTSH